MTFSEYLNEANGIFVSDKRSAGDAFRLISKNPDIAYAAQDSNFFQFKNKKDFNIAASLLRKNKIKFDRE